MALHSLMGSPASGDLTGKLSIMRVYLHIGMHKTGTTSVQRVLLKNSEKLRELGYRAYVNSLQINVKRSEYFDPAWLRHQVKLAERDGLQAVIFSAETISTFNSEQLHSFMEPFHGYDVCFIVCFRHWVNFLPSRWTQNCIRRDTQSFPAYLKNLRSDDTTHVDARFDLVANRMIAANPHNIRIISYDNAALFGNLLPTCLNAFDLPESFVNDVQRVGLRANARRDFETTELVRLFNGLYSLRNKFEGNELFIGTSNDVYLIRIFNFYSKIQLILHEHEELKNQLSGILKESNITMMLSRNDPYIVRWEQLLKEISLGHTINLYKDMLFADVPDVEFVCSEIEIDDIPLKIQEKMAFVFGIAEK